MNRYICDHCRKEEPPADNYVPPGWFSLNRRYDPTQAGRGVPETQHFCSPACGASYFRTLQEREPTTRLAAVLAADTTAAIEPDPLRLQ